MPNAKMPPNDAPLTSPELYENLHFGQSLMERAARGGTLLQQYKRDAVRHSGEIATSSVAQQQADLALKQERYKLHETERGLAQRARLHAEFDLDALGGAIDLIRDLQDPVEQASRINRLRAQYAHFRADPVLARSIDVQLGTLAPIVEENRLARVQERIAANRYARTPEEAAARFPGYLIRTEFLPTGQNDRGETQFSPIYLAEDQVDPRLEAEAFQQLRLVNLQNTAGEPTTALERLNSLAEHPSVAAVLGVPGSRFADTYIAEIELTRGGAAPFPITSTPQTTPSSSTNLPEIDQRETALPGASPGASSPPAPREMSIAAPSGEGRSLEEQLAAGQTDDGTWRAAGSFTIAPAMIASFDSRSERPVVTIPMLESHLNWLRSLDRQWRREHEVEAKYSLGGSPYAGKIRALDEAVSATNQAVDATNALLFAANKYRKIIGKSHIDYFDKNILDVNGADMTEMLRGTANLKSISRTIAEITVPVAVGKLARLLPVSESAVAAESNATRLFPEYTRFREQGFAPAQAKYLAEPYEGMGHHFIPRRSPLPEAIIENPANIMGKGMSRGRFYERHFLGDPYFHGTAFPRSIGGRGVVRRLASLSRCDRLIGGMLLQIGSE